jgi:hypothetical protein
MYSPSMGNRLAERSVINLWQKLSTCYAAHVSVKVHTSPISRMYCLIRWVSLERASGPGRYDVVFFSGGNRAHTALPTSRMVKCRHMQNGRCGKNGGCSVSLGGASSDVCSILTERLWKNIDFRRFFGVFLKPLNKC